MRRLLALLLLLSLGIGAAPAAPPPEAKTASVALVFATDVSGSVTPDTYLLQMEGIARAIEDRRVLGVVAAAPGGIEVMLLQWSNPRDAVASVPWTRVTDAASAHRFALSVRRASRSSRGLTAIGSAILAAIRQFGDMPVPAARRVIDISGDGMANFGVAPQVARDAAVEAGITINGLAVLTHEPWLADYYRHKVIGGPASFVLVARSPASFAAAMRRKLAGEIAGTPLDFALRPPHPGRKSQPKSSDSSFRGAAEDREPGIHEHRPSPMSEKLVFLDSGPRPEPVLGPRGARTRGGDPAMTN